MSDERVEAEATAHYLLGVSGGWERASDWLLTKAVNEFQNGRDKEAVVMRQLAQEAKDKEKAARKDYEKQRLKADNLKKAEESGADDES